MFQCPGWMRKNFILGISAEGQQRTHEMQVASKKVYWKNNRVLSEHLRHIAIEKDILSELNRCIFQISLKYIKLVIPKILFILVLCSFDFYFKITRLPLPNKVNPPPHQKKNFCPPPSRDFSEIFNPPFPPSWSEGGCMP